MLVWEFILISIIWLISIPLVYLAYKKLGFVGSVFVNLTYFFEAFCAFALIPVFACLAGPLEIEPQDIFRTAVNPLRSGRWKGR
jgi:hypothetical protein